MSNEAAYDPMADVSRYLQTPPPPPEPRLLVAPGDESVASHVVGAPQDVPAVQMGVASVEAPQPLIPEAAAFIRRRRPTASRTTRTCSRRRLTASLTIQYRHRQ
ncbi:unnamed protein product [Urochloa humidicola]